jgi:hypothetical protein
MLVTTRGMGDSDDFSRDIIRPSATLRSCEQLQLLDRGLPAAQVGAIGEQGGAPSLGDDERAHLATETVRRATSSSASLRQRREGGSVHRLHAEAGMRSSISLARD